ncbi:type II toxin-antitoxin system RelE/ParE family toxin [Jiella sp. M17.18]|uniref:type II toxin-antitoxin system RelE/ParE family toxin n=1 Tax=Jiella sp. M17.18 TaxID=3234247 RepID=UPI0034DDFA3E
MRSFELTLAAEQDLHDIWRYARDQWGVDQAETYFDRIEACCEAIGNGLKRSKMLVGLPVELRLSRCEHHYIVWLNEPRPVIIAILHERMDFLQRLKGRL